MENNVAFLAGEFDLDSDLWGFKPKLVWDKDFALDFEDVVPLMYTNVLLVEDDTTTSGYVKSLIRRTVNNPLRVRSFSSAEKAGEYIHSLKEHHLPGPDYAIIDYLLTGQADGLWLCKMLEKRFPETRAILISTVAKEVLNEKMEEYNIRPIFIQKPLGPQSLFELIS